jgi:hypothetical protein
MRCKPYIRVYATTTADEPTTAVLDRESTQLVAVLRGMGYEPDIALLNTGSTKIALSWARHLERAGISDSESRPPAVWAELGHKFFMRCGSSEEIKREVLQKLDMLTNEPLTLPMVRQGVTVYAHSLCLSSESLIQDLKRVGIRPRVRYCGFAAVEYEMAALIHHKEEYGPFVVDQRRMYGVYTSSLGCSWR